MFGIEFSNPWYLLLLIPAVAFTLIPYFRLSKRYRRTRNRITSMVLHMLVMFFAITLLAGLRFIYTEPNTQNEIIILVDVSETEEQSARERDEFVETVLKDARYDNYNVGVVTFGFDQNYAVPLTNDVESIYDAYKAAALPDTSATNIASALTYAKTLFTNPEAGKIVLVTDGKETDEEARSVIRSIATQGLSIDVAYVGSAYVGNDALITGVEMPDYYVAKGEECSITVTVQSRGENEISISMYDNDELSKEGKQVVTFEEGDSTKTITFLHSFDSEGLHALSFEMDVYDDILEHNNVYCSYYYLDIFNNILILQKEDNTSDDLIAMLNAEGSSSEKTYEITPVTITSELVPTSLDALRLYDQIILNNISNDDLELHEGLDEMLQSYVYDCGGGLFTVGGTSEDSSAVNAYDPDDMNTKEASVYREMLPVRAVEYTPPVAIELIIDRSGSMTETGSDGTTFFDAAVAGAVALLDGLEAKDYMGIMTLDDTYAEILPLTPGSQRDRIKEAIGSISDPNGNTNFGTAIESAAQRLWDQKDVAKRHIIIITDGAPGDAPEDYQAVIAKAFKDKGVTLSILLIGSLSKTIEDAMWDAVNSVGALVDYEVPENKKGKVYTAANTGDVVTGILEDLAAPTITDINEEPFYPIINNVTSPLFQGVERGENNRLTMQLGGFYGVEARNSADTVLVGDYNVPIYVQWKYGAGMVGSFMSDLQYTEWSAEFMADESGQKFIRNVVNNLMPTQSIRLNEITVRLVEDNYTNVLNVYTDLAEGEYVKGVISYETKEGNEYTVSLNEVGDPSVKSDCYVTVALSADNKYSRCNFVAKEGCAYTITLTKVKADGTEISCATYKSFGYSEEYDTTITATEEELEEKLTDWANRGNGVLIGDLEDPWEIFENFITEFVRVFDPRFLFMILAIILFLLDIAVRKFKFKWPHEIIRDHKNRKSSK